MGGGGLKGRPGAPHQILWLLSPAAAGKGPATAGKRGRTRLSPYGDVAVDEADERGSPLTESLLRFKV